MDLTTLDGPSCALILAGAGSKGAFEAGAVSELLLRGHRFQTLVGASAGALNAALLASAIRVLRAGDRCWRAGACELSGLPLGWPHNSCIRATVLL